MINLKLQDLTNVVKNTNDFTLINKSIKKSKAKSSFVLLLSDVVALLISFVGSIITKFLFLNQLLVLLIYIIVMYY
ncbi:MAG: hypothetical protein ACOVNU_03695 [Candidatus Kapaibacteriota bacterium]